MGGQNLKVFVKILTAALSEEGILVKENTLGKVQQDDSLLFVLPRELGTFCEVITSPDSTGLKTMADWLDEWLAARSRWY